MFVINRILFQKPKQASVEQTLGGLMNKIKKCSLVNEFLPHLFIGLLAGLMIIGCGNSSRVASGTTGDDPPPAFGGTVSCGDGVCGSDETNESCPEDCFVDDSDIISPTATMTSPVDGAVDVDPYVEIVVTFSEPMNTESYPAGGASFITVTGPEGNIDGRFTSTNITGSFVSLTRLDYSTTYTVSVSVDTLSDLSGNVLGGSNSWSFTTRSAAWEPVSSLYGSTAGAQVTDLNAGIDDNGNSFVIWSYKDSNAYFNHFSNDLWQAEPTRLGNELGAVDSVDIGVNARGNVVGLWSEKVEVDGYSIFSSTYNLSSNSWGPVLEADDSPIDAISIDADMDSTGNTFVAWKKTSGAASGDIFANIYNFEGAAWGLLLEVDDAVTVATDPKVSVNSDGRAEVVWIQDGNVWGSNYAGAGMGMPEGLSGIEGGCRNPEVALSDNGTFTAVWSEADGVHMYRVGVELAIGVVIAPGRLTSLPQVDMDEDGNTVIVWDDDTGIYFSYYKAGLWSVPEQVSDAGSLPQVVFDANGDAWIAWTQAGDVYARFYDMSAIDSPGRYGPVSIRDNDGAVVSLLDLAVNSYGEAVIAWVENEHVMSSVLR